MAPPSSGGVAAWEEAGLLCGVGGAAGAWGLFTGVSGRESRAFTARR